MIDVFFERYAAAFLNFEPANVSQVYEFPMTFFTELGEIVSFDECSFLENTTKLIALYQELGVKIVEFTILDKMELSEHLLLVSVNWCFKNSMQADIYSATTRYVIRSTKHGLKIKAVFVVDETRKLKALMQK